VVEKQTPGATIIPIILTSDKTQVTSFDGKSVYPVYITIGNIPKDIRRKPSTHTQTLLAYLPVSSLDHIDSATSWRHAVPNLFHPEQCLAACTKANECPKGTALPNSLGEQEPCHLRDAADILDALEAFDPDKQPKEYRLFCKGVGIKPVVHPFCQGMAYTT